MNELNKNVTNIIYKICQATVGFDLSSVEPMTEEELFEYRLKHVTIDENGNEVWHKDEIKTPWKYGNKL